MAIPRSVMHRHVPVGLCDCIDGTNAYAGAMRSLVNLVPDPTTRGMWIARPGAVKVVDFVTFSTPGVVSSLLVVGDLAFGTIGSARFSGKDEPFCYNLATPAFLTVGGILTGNVPTTQAATGAWTPPILAQIAGRIIVTHPGFPGSTVKFGWFDVSGFTASLIGNTHTSTLVDGGFSVVGVMPGMTISGTNIPAAATVVSTANVVLSQAGDTHTSTLVDALPVSAARAIGQVVAGVGIPTGTKVSALTSSTSVTMDTAATATAAAVSLTFTGVSITISAAATGSTAGSTFAVAGGTVAAPLWGAGDTDRNNLLSVPVGVALLYGRAYYACGINGIRYSDSGFPCRVSDTIAVQALTTSDGLAVTAIAPMRLSNPVTGAPVQGLVAFEGAVKIQMITGDQVIPATSTAIADGGLSTLTMNVLPISTGTLAPLSIFSCELGLGFMSPSGLRFVKPDGGVTLPIGAGGEGVIVPFINALHPSRICAAANNDTLRFTTQNASLAAPQPWEEYFYSISRKVWSGPHTSTAALIQPWRSSFLMSFVGVSAFLYQSDSRPASGSVFTENAVALEWLYKTVLMPDSGSGNMVACVEMTLACELASGTRARVRAISDRERVLATTRITASGPETLWEGFNWGAALWSGQTQGFYQRSIDWPIPLVFRQAAIEASGQSDISVRVGNLYMMNQQLGYKIQEFG